MVVGSVLAMVEPVAVPTAEQEMAVAVVESAVVIQEAFASAVPANVACLQQNAVQMGAIELALENVAKKLKKKITALID